MLILDQFAKRQNNLSSSGSKGTNYKQNGLPLYFAPLQKPEKK
jgi:hypothetical protein